MILLDVTIPGQPVAKGRPRAYSQDGIVRLYTPKETVRWEDNAALIMSNARNDRTSLDACTLNLVAVFKRPQRLMRKKDSEELIIHDKKPDLDNVIKAACDAIVKCGAIADDGQIASIAASKWYAEKKEAPRVEILLEAFSATQAD